MSRVVSDGAGVRLERSTHGVKRPIEPGPRRALGDPEDEARLRGGQPDVKVQDQDRALLDGEPPKAAFDLIAIGEIGRPIADRRVGLVERVREDAPPTVSVCFPVTRPHEETMEPPIPRSGIAQGADVSPGQDERFLDRILGAVGIPEDQRGDAVQATCRCLGQGGKGGVVSLTSPFDEVSIHPHRPCGATAFGALTE